MLEEAIAVELEEFLTSLSERRDGHGRRAVVRNGFQPEREILTGIGPVAVTLPKVRSRDGEPAFFARGWCRRMSGGPVHSMSHYAGCTCMASQSAT